MRTTKWNADDGSITKKELKILPPTLLEATVTKNIPQTRESNVRVNDINEIDTFYNNVNPSSITDDNYVAFNSMLTDITTMGEDFLCCGKASFQNNDISHLTDASH